MKKLKLKEMTLCALFIALVAVGAFIKIPVGTDIFTLQFLFTLLAGLLLGGKLGATAVGVYTLLGLIGAPVFAEGGGPAYVLQPTFGYLVGFILQAWFTGVMARRGQHITLPNMLAVNLGGMVIVYTFGLIYFYISSNYIIHAPIAIWPLILYSGILQIPGDFCLCCLAALLSVRCYKAGIWLDIKKNDDSIKIEVKEA
jgi:biotin transport system substrate-specific component